ncbi:hypothetical protein KGV52_01105 [Candidatus Gracilibacteria bacterium]|nr:hypothetical protein [Candidatus Gracilibacteria bacterium]
MTEKSQEKLEKLYKDLCAEVQSEIQKASQLLGFLGILIFVALGKLSDVDMFVKIFIFIVITISVVLLLFTILGKGILGLPKSLKKIERQSIKKDMQYLKNNYNISYKIWKEKHTLNVVSFILLIIIFISVVFAVFFL